MYALIQYVLCCSEQYDKCECKTRGRTRLTLSNVLPIGRAMRGSVLAPHHCPHIQKKKPCGAEGDRHSAWRRTRERNWVGTKGPENKQQPTSKGEAAPFPMLINMRTRNDEADLTPQELFTLIAQEPSPYTAWRAPPCPKADTKLTTTRRRSGA